jgi:hypothetical protein
MTKDRARKHAARQRAAVTGERYVVAQRGFAPPEPLTQKSGRMHDLTHKVPGVPSHVDGGLQGVASPRRNTSPRLQNRARRNERHGEPRVLVAWQNWIARRVGVGGR